MRLKSVFISQYKNLKDFTLSFDGDSFIDVFVGKNGSGKSNLFEALTEIFHHIYEYDKAKGVLDFEYVVEYEIDGKETSIAWEFDQFKINGKARKSIGQTPLPDNVLIYYSGHNTTISRLVKRYEDAFRSRIKQAGAEESRRFISIGSEYKSLLLSVLLFQKSDNNAKQFICKKLGIRGIAPDLSVTLKRPDFAGRNIEIEAGDPASAFWGARGVAREFLDKLLGCIKGAYNLGGLYNNPKDIYEITVDIELFQGKFSDESVTDIFRQFDNLKILGMLSEISIPLTLTSGVDATINHFSDGQFQSVYIYSIVELFKDRNCLTLLDEPDSFLHPEWQFDFLKQVFDIADTAKKNHVLMSSHSASTITTADESTIRLFEFDGSNVGVTRVNKADVIKSLSAGLISFSENEARLSINHVLENTKGAVLFTEGITDELILETAWSKLYPRKKINFEIQNAFDRTFLRNLFSRDELNKNFPGRMMFALFDFDDAYDDWNGLKKKCDPVTDPHKGLVKQLKCECHFAMLLPIPTDDELKRQVLDASGKPWGKGSQCHLSIELLFYPGNYLADHFTKRAISGGGEIVEFSGDKVKFAKDVVPALGAACFEVFRPIFEFIELKCGATTTTKKPPV